VKNVGVAYGVTAAGIGLLLLLGALGRRVPPRPAGFPELIRLLTVQDADYPAHGPYHAIKAEVERDLWRFVSKLSVQEGGDRILLTAVEQVYTKYHSNFLAGYIFHYPYLNSRKAIALVDKLEDEYPDSPLLARALLLKAFAYRVRPPPEGHEIHESFSEQLTWRPDADKAREIYRTIVERWPDSAEARSARAALEEPELEIDLPFSHDDDPRRLPQ
jgi:hypothetical protein